MITHEYEEYKPVRQIWTWLIILTLAALTLSWGMVTHMAVPDVARQWDFDVLPDTPGISPYATEPPPEVSPRAAADRSARRGHSNPAAAHLRNFGFSAIEGRMRRIRIVAHLAGAAAALGLAALGLGTDPGRVGWVTEDQDWW